MDKTIEVPLDEILDLVLASTDCGFGDDVFLSTTADWSGYVTNKEIEDFGLDLVNNQDYTEADKYHVIVRLKDWRNQYCKRKKKKSSI